MGLSTREVQIQRAVAFAKASNPTFPFQRECSSAGFNSYAPAACPISDYSIRCGRNRNLAGSPAIGSHPCLMTPHIATGKTHPLSNYTPVCHTCGLPLCFVNLPYYPCPHPPCRTSLLSSAPDPFRVQLQPLIARIENEIKDQLKKEEDERVLAAEELKLREGAFPMLRASPSPSPSPSPASQPSHVRSGGGPVANHPQNQGYSVMSLTAGKGGKRSQVKVSSYRPGNISKSSSSSSLQKDAEDDVVVRIRCPPAQVEPIKAL